MCSQQEPQTSGGGAEARGAGEQEVTERLHALFRSQDFKLNSETTPFSRNILPAGMNWRGQSGYRKPMTEAGSLDGGFDDGDGDGGEINLGGQIKSA